MLYIVHVYFMIWFNDPHFVWLNISSLTALLFDYFLIIVHYSDTGNVFKVFQSQKQQSLINNIFMSINIIQVQDSPTFVLA